jgi:hypothetical protein
MKQSPKKPKTGIMNCLKLPYIFPFIEKLFSFSGHKKPPSGLPARLKPE